MFFCIATKKNVKFENALKFFPYALVPKKSKAKKV